MGDGRFKRDLLVIFSNISDHCEVYALASGNIQFRDLTNNSWSGNLTSFLPAYYVTNCSAKALESYIESFSAEEYSAVAAAALASPFNQRGNGDTFVALLFVISGACMASWMMSLLLYLSPKHKTKPLLAKLATIVYSVFMTILIHKLTKIAETQYYADELNLVDVQNAILFTNSYRVILVLSQFITLLAWLQLMMHMTKNKWKRYIFCIGSLLIILITVLSTINEALYENLETFLSSSRGDSAESWNQAIFSMILVYVSLLAGVLLYFTTVEKNPRKICYSTRILPLALFIWVVIALHVILNILMLTLYRDDWQTRLWLQLLPCQIDVILITIIWEWIFNISILEKRVELTGVLGRRISFDDAASFDSNKKRPRTYLIYENGANVFNFMKNVFKKEHLVTKDDLVLDHSQTSNEGKGFVESSTSSGTAVESQTEDERVQLEPVLGFEVNEEELGNSQTEFQERNIGNRDEANSLTSYEEEYVEYNWEEDEEEAQVASSSNVRRESVESLPNFEPHPGFSREDYWNDRKE